MSGDIFIISAPSGTGKSTIIRRLLKMIPGLFFSVSYTTRQQRKNEIQGKDYCFVSQEEFTELINNNEFLEYCEVHGNTYGTSEKQVLSLIEKGFDIILDIDVQGAMKVKQKCPAAITIFMLPPSIKDLEERWQKRHSDSEQDKKIRRNNINQELQFWHFYDYLVINKYINETVEQVKAIIIANRCRKDKQETLFRTIINEEILPSL
ncbi:MAG: guanylate kinase [Candidatus Fischerbacteria bacterium RBG_13_37_8]|uniref:Guanylate kinase n=1 Tax=Candidatus Fischerbacteria bacterium RBG_13_37_8 TaxID=1817863 RepID=A0A1F5V6B7_9BACT|nr:MAG: guanylate kinase [Candidatus Fischerbacteria bacterium RBG_13_37_8]